MKVERLSLSGRKDDESSLVYDRLPTEGSTLVKLKLNAESKTWIDLGRDEKLETVILKRIEKQIK